MQKSIDCKEVPLFNRQVFFGSKSRSHGEIRRLRYRRSPVWHICSRYKYCFIGLSKPHQSRPTVYHLLPSNSRFIFNLANSLSHPQSSSNFHNEVHRRFRPSSPLCNLCSCSTSTPNRRDETPRPRPSCPRARGLH